MATGDAASELERLATKLPPQARQLVEAAAAVLRRPYRGGLAAQAAGRLSAPVRLQDSGLAGKGVGRVLLRARLKRKSQARHDWVDSALASSLLETARNLEEQADLEGARNRYTEVLGLFPTGEPAARSLEGLLRTFQSGVGRADLAKAATRLAEWAREHLKMPRNVEAAELFACRVLYRGEAYEKALAAVELFRERHPKSKLLPNAAFVEGLVYLRKDKKEKALPVFQRILKETAIDPEVAQKALFLIGWIHLFDQDFARARTALEAVVQEYPESKYAEKAKELLRGLSTPRSPAKKGKPRESREEDHERF